MVLEDPKNLFAAQNVVPLINADKATPEVDEALNAVSAKLTTETLTELLDPGHGRQAGLRAGRAGVGRRECELTPVGR